MKHLISLVILMAFATPAFATKNENLSAETMAKLLTSRQSASCLAEIHDIQSKYDLWVMPSSAKRIPTANGFSTEVQFDAIEGGDIMVGTVTLKVVEKYGEQFGFPGSKMLYVDSCSVSKNLQE